MTTLGALAFGETAFACLSDLLFSLVLLLSLLLPLGE